MDQKTEEDIRKLASLGYTPEQVLQALCLEFLAAAFDDCESKTYRAYWAGFYETDIPLRKSIFDLAKKGSSPAQTLAIRLLEQKEMREFYER